MNEAQYNREQIAAIKGFGTFAYKTSDSFQVGIPDIYICGGKWIESKVVSVSGKRPFGLLSEISGFQHKWMQRLEENGDKCWVSVLIQFPDEKRFICSKYHNIVTTPHKIDRDWVELACEKYTKENLIERMRYIAHV